MTPFRTHVSDKNSLCGFYILDFGDLSWLVFFVVVVAFKYTRGLEVLYF